MTNCAAWFYLLFERRWYDPTAHSQWFPSQVCSLKWKVFIKTQKGLTRNYSGLVYFWVSTNNRLSSQEKLNSGSKPFACLSLTNLLTGFSLFSKKCPSMGDYENCFCFFFFPKSLFLGFFLSFPSQENECQDTVPMYDLESPHHFSFPTKSCSNREFKFWHPGLNIHDEVLHFFSPFFFVCFLLK